MARTKNLLKIRHHYTRSIATILLLLEKIFYDHKVIQVLKKNVNGSGIVVFDVGANRGQSIDLYLKHLEIDQIHAFEPSRAVFNILLKKYSNSKLVLNNVAVSNSNGISVFYESLMDETSSLVLPRIESNYHKLKSKILLVRPEKMFTPVKVNTLTIDDYCKTNLVDLVHLLKIDVEGGELEVLIGASRMLKSRNIFCVQIERHENDMRRNANFDINQLMSELNYKLDASIKHSFGNFFDDFWVPRV
jgi:FkbM family methyltransferase